MGAFQLLWTCGACAFFLVMEHSVKAKGEQMEPGAAFEEFFKPEYRHLFYILCALMMFGYCPALLWLSRRRLFRESWPAVGKPGVSITQAKP